MIALHMAIETLRYKIDSIILSLYISIITSYIRVRNIANYIGE